MIERSVLAFRRVAENEKLGSKKKKDNKMFPQRVRSSVLEFKALHYLIRTISRISNRPTITNRLEKCHVPLFFNNI